MNKQLIAALALGASLGAGGKTIIDGALSSAEAKVVVPTAHAVDLRRDYNGDNFRFVVYGNRQRDAGYDDLNQPKKCSKLSDATRAQLIACMNIAGAACEW